MKSKLTLARLTPAHAKKIIPHGQYCYDENGNCPFWSKVSSMPHQENGYCRWLDEGDWDREGLSLLWDQCKECGINEETNHD